MELVGYRHQDEIRLGEIVGTGADYNGGPPL